MPSGRDYKKAAGDNQRAVMARLADNRSWRFVGRDKYDPKGEYWQRNGVRLYADEIGLFYYLQAEGQWQRRNGVSWDRAVVPGSNPIILQFCENDRYPAVLVKL